MAATSPNNLEPFNNQTLWNALNLAVATLNVHSPFSVSNFQPNKEFRTYLEHAQMFGGRLGGGAFGDVYTAPKEIVKFGRDPKYTYNRFFRFAMSINMVNTSPRRASDDERRDIGVYSVKDGMYKVRLAVKVQHPCIGGAVGGDFEALERYSCRELEEEKDVQWLPHLSKWYLAIPSALVEGMVNLHLNMLENKTEHFIKSFGAYMIPSKPNSLLNIDRAKSYIVMERATPFVVDGNFP